jgi:hypothetical protein
MLMNNAVAEISWRFWRLCERTIIFDSGYRIIKEKYFDIVCYLQ